MPITALAIEHPEVLFVVDTGETARIAKPDYTACDSVTGMFYISNLKFSLTPEYESGPQMQRAGLLPDRVNTIIMTHLHSDHMGGMGSLPPIPAAGPHMLYHGAVLPGGSIHRH